MGNVPIVGDSGDVMPRLEVVTVERVQPGEIYWGCGMATDGGSSKGWLVEREGIPVPDGVQTRTFTVSGVEHTWWIVEGRQFRRGSDLVLVQKRS